MRSRFECDHLHRPTVIRGALRRIGTGVASEHVLNQIVVKLRARSEAGTRCASRVADAVTDALVRRRDSQLRAMKGHWLKQGGAGVAEAIGAAEKALKKMPIAKLVSQALEGKVDKKSLGYSKTQVNLDEELRGGANADPD